MRFRSIAVVTLLSFGAVGTARAQTTAAQCPNGSGPVDPVRIRQDACQQTVDLLNYMLPQLGLAITGGNATLAQGGSLGGLPHFTVGVRANLVAGGVPQVIAPAITGAQQRTNYPTKTTLLGLPAVDASIGLFKGLPLGVTNVGGVDLLLSVAYVPKVTASNVTVSPKKSTEIGYGVRIGLLQESLLVPGVSFTFLQRGLPTTTITGTVSGSTLEVRDLDLKTTAWRLAASKSLILFTIAAGVGQDKYDASTTIATSVGGAVSPTFPLEQKLTRTNYFGDVSMNILLLKLVGEIGMVSGGTVPTYNTFSTKADASRVYGSVGVRFGF